MAKGERDWVQLESFEVEYAERLAEEAQRDNSAFRWLLNGLASGEASFVTEALRSRDEQIRRLITLRGKILSLREKLQVANETDTPLLAIEKDYITVPLPQEAAKRTGIRFYADPLPPDFIYPVTFDEIRGVLAELPPEHVATIQTIRLSNQRRTGTDGDYLDGDIRLHCSIGTDGRRLMQRLETGGDVERFGGTFAWEGNKLYAIWGIENYKIFVLRRVLIHEIAHGVATLPGSQDKIRRVGNEERFCEQYAENFYRPAGKSVRLPF